MWRVSKSFQLLIVALLLSPANCFGWQEVPQIQMLAEHVGVDVSGTIHIPEFAALASKLRNHVAFSEEGFLEATDFLLEIDEEFAKQMERFFHCLGNVDSVHVFAWSSRIDSGNEDSDRSSKKLPQYAISDCVIVLKVKPINDVIDNAKFANGLLLGSKDGRDGTSERKQGIAVECFEDWVIIGNSVERVEHLQKSLAGKFTHQKKLADDRTFRTAMSEFKNSGHGAIFAFARPERFPEIFGDSRGDERAAQLENLRELPSAGMVVRILGDERSIIVESYVSCTLPVVGLASHWNAMKPLPDRFPEFCYPIRGTEIWAWDPVELQKSQRESYDLAHGPGKYNQLLKEQFGDRAEEIVADYFGGFSETYFVRYENEIGQRESIRIDKIEDFESAKRYLQFEVENANKNRSQPRMVELNDAPDTAPDAVVYGPPLKKRQRSWRHFLDRLESEASSREKWEREYKSVLEKTGKSLEEIGIDLIENDGWVVTEQWRFSGRLSDVFELIDYMNGQSSSKENRLGLLNERVDWLLHHCNMGRPEMLYSGDSHIDKVNDCFTALLESKYGDDRATIKEILSGASFGKLKENENFAGDLYDIAGFLVCRAITSRCRDTIIVRRVENDGGKLKTAIGVVFDED